MKLYALSQRSGETYDAAGKAMHDVFAMLAKNGFKTVWSMPKSCNKYLKILDLPYLATLLFFGMRKGDYIFFSIPENHIKIKLLKKIQKIKKYSIICFINDLNAFRYGNMEQENVKSAMRQEAAIIGMADYVLIPNENTASLLRNNGVESKLIPVGVWDYLMTDVQQRHIADAAKSSHLLENEIRIAFAGNLNKSEFLFEMELPQDTKLHMELWGKLDEEKKAKLPEFCTYHGVLPADEVPEAISHMDYGLVWDGTGKDSVEGGLGEYLQYNNSHKCGLYLASGIPAIVWSKAGMANFVRKHECGICIERLMELEEKLLQSNYEIIKNNTLSVSEKLQKGYYLQKALEEILGDS